VLAAGIDHHHDEIVVLLVVWLRCSKSALLLVSSLDPSVATSGQQCRQRARPSPRRDRRTARSPASMLVKCRSHRDDVVARNLCGSPSPRKPCPEDCCPCLPHDLEHTILLDASQLVVASDGELRPSLAQDSLFKDLVPQLRAFQMFCHSFQEL
jgi:hypothetical protein